MKVEAIICYNDKEKGFVVKGSQWNTSKSRGKQLVDLGYCKMVEIVEKEEVIETSQITTNEEQVEKKVIKSKKKAKKK